MDVDCTVGVVCSLGVGPERGGRDTNEDNYLVATHNEVRFRKGDGERTEHVEGVGALVAVCDGMGGHQGGEVASTTAARVLAKLYQPRVPPDPSSTLRTYLLDAHRRLYARTRAQGPVEMGTTVTSAWLLQGRAHWAHLGDSRLYLFRQGRLTQLSADHTREEFARRDGRVVGHGGAHLAQNFLYGSRGLGDDRDVRIDPGLDTGSEALQPGDRLLLCTDGVTGSVDDVSLAQVLTHTPDPQAAAVACMERAIARGSTDNITAIVVGVG